MVARSVRAGFVVRDEAMLVRGQFLDERFLAALRVRVIRCCRLAGVGGVAVVVAECERPGRSEPLEDLGIADEVGHLREDGVVQHDEVAVDDDEVGVRRRDEVLDEGVGHIVAGAAHHIIFFRVVHLRVGEHHDVELSAVLDVDRGIAVRTFGGFHESGRSGLVVAGGESDERERKKRRQAQ